MLIHLVLKLQISIGGWHAEPYSAENEIPSTAIKNQGAPAQLLYELDIWTETTSTSTVSELYWGPHWEPNTDYHILVVMNKDGSSDVNFDLQLGFKVPILTWLSYLLLPL